MAKEGSKLTIVLISVIVILLGILAYGVYTGFKVKAEIARLNGDLSDVRNQLVQVSADKEKLNTDYNMLMADVAEIYKTCREGACKGRYPNVSWYCNNVGDEAPTNYSHVCKCDASCKLVAVQVNN